MRRDNQDLWTSYARALRARNCSPRTAESYRLAVRELDEHAKKYLTKATKGDIEDYIGRRLTEIAPSTVAIRFRSLRAFYNWLEAEEIIGKTPMRGMKEPKVEDEPPPVIDDEDLKALLKSCAGKEFNDRRDEAIIRVFCEPGGPRLSEVAGMELDDLDLRHDMIRVKGKGSKVRVFPFGSKAGTAIDRYLRLRREHRHRKRPALWLGERGPLTASGIAQIIERRAKAAGIGHIHPHQLRHTSANAWFAEGGSEQDAMYLFGWSSPEMPRRYGRAAAVGRAQQASRRVSLGDRL